MNPNVAIGIIDGFIWARTREGGKFWQAVYNLARGEKATIPIFVPGEDNTPLTKSPGLLDRAIKELRTAIPYSKDKALWDDVLTRMQRIAKNGGTSIGGQDKRLLLEVKMRN